MEQSALSISPAPQESDLASTDCACGSISLAFVDGGAQYVIDELARLASGNKLIRQLFSELIDEDPILFRAKFNPVSAVSQDGLAPVEPTKWGVRVLATLLAFERQLDTGSKR